MLIENSAIGRFLLEDHKELFDLNLIRALYLVNSWGNHVYVIECRDYEKEIDKILVFEYGCNGLVSIEIEYGTFNKYLMIIADANNDVDNAEYADLSIPCKII